MPDPRDYKLDLSTEGTGQPPSQGKRPYLSVQFACCGTYQRIYRSADGQSYQGRCPRCGKPVKFTVGDGGTDSRSFVVY